MLRPHGPDFIWASQFTALNLGFCFGQIGFFLSRQLDPGLINAGELQHDVGKLVLPGLWQSGHCAEGFSRGVGSCS